MHVSLREHIYAGDDKWFLALAVGGRERERERKRGTGKQRAEERTRVLRRCVVTDDPYFQMYYILPVLLSALVCSASSEIPVATACRRSGSRVVKKRREKEEEEEEETVEAKAKRATAITGDGKRGEKMIVASTRRVQAHIYLCVASRCWAFVPMMDVYHVRQRPRHLLHHRHLVSFFFLRSLPRCRPASIRCLPNQFFSNGFLDKRAIFETKRSLRKRRLHAIGGFSWTREVYFSYHDTYER